MGTFKLYTLGCGSAKPTPRHYTSCSVLNHRETLYMIDCGEGAQVAFMKARLKPTRLRHIFLTHLHGDQILGLPGLLMTYNLSQIGGTLTIHTFAEGERIMREILRTLGCELNYNIEFDIIKPEDKVILETSSLTVRTVALDHRVPCVGYIFEEKPGQRHIIREMVDYHQVPVSRMKDIKDGADYITPEGKVIPNGMLTSDADPAPSYAHIGDTRYMEGISEKIGPVDLLYHETTYLEEHRGDARDRYHSTARQAAMVARDAGVGTLLTGHYSSRYKDETLIKAEAETIFHPVILNDEGLVTDIDRLCRERRKSLR